MPQGTGRGDGDEGSKPNLHIGYLEFMDDNGKPAMKPYIRSTPDIGRRVHPEGTVFEFNVWRYKLVRMGNGENSNAIEDEGNGIFHRNKPYIKIAEIIDDPESNPDVESNDDLDELKRKHFSEE